MKNIAHLSVWFVACFLINCLVHAQTEFRPGGSADVHYSFPQNPQQISVGRNGENSFALKVPTFPAYVTPSVSAIYNSRGGDGVMGVGWELGFPSIALDFSETRDSLDTVATNQMLNFEGEYFIKDRWQSNPGGGLLCSREDKVETLDGLQCYNDPHGPIRFTPIGQRVAERWIAQDPLEAITQEFGNNDASRIYHGDQVVSWLISRQVSSSGKEVRYFYEERPNSQQRLLRAILMGGNKTILFNYTARVSNINSSYDLGVERRSEWLLDEIVLRRACRPIQRIDNPDDVWVDFSNCRNVSPVEKVKLSYRQPSQGYTGRYVLRSWQHMSGDESVSYQAVEFDYRGDGNSARGNGVVTEEIVNPVNTSLDLPDGYSMITNSGYAPFQNYADWNRDGLTDWISVKADDDEFWPNWDTQQHHIQVHLRNAARDFDPPQTFEEPLAKYAAWMGSTSIAGWRTLFTGTRDALTSDQITVTPDGMADLVETHRPQANIGIDVTPWMYNPNDTESRPIFKSLSMTVACRRLDIALCENIKNTYENVWSRVVSKKYDEVGIKLTDLHDFNGDGYLDRSLSGLLVIWDPNAPDADANGFRSPLSGDPAIYVSLFDPDSAGFKPFVRYEIARPSGEFAGLSSAFLSALAINHKWNGSVSTGDMSGQTVARSLVTAAGAVGTVVSLSSAFNPKHAAANPPTTTAGQFSSGFNKVDSALDAGFIAANIAVSATNAPPEVTTGLAAAQLVHSGVSGVYSAAEGVRVAIDAASTTTEVAGGWASAGGAVFAVAAQVVNFAWRQRSKQRMQAEGYNAGAIASNTKTGTAVVSIVAAGAGLAITILAAAGVIAVAGGPPGIIIGIVLAVISIAISAWQIVGPEGNFSTRDGKVYYQMHAQRGVWYTDDSVVNPVPSQLEHTGKSFDLLDWFDIDGDRRLDLVVARFNSDQSGFAVSRGAITESFEAPHSRPWRAWRFPVDSPGIPPDSIRESIIRTEYKGNDSQRADLIDSTLGFVDINGDGLADLIDASGNTSNGIYAYLNNGHSFIRETSFPISNNTLPNGCTSAFMLSRSRSLAWTEFLGTTEGYALALSNVTQMLGPDLDNNGLPDLVIKDETRYPNISSGGNCVVQPTSNMCSNPLPVDPEPEPTGQNTCRDGADVWYAQFDGVGVTTGQGEGTSHISPAARDVYDPSIAGTHYVAFNTGNGFTPFVEIEQQMPSFGGGLSVVSTVNTNDDLPDPAISGTTNILGDPDADGILHVIGMDLGDDVLLQTTGVNPMLDQIQLGIKNPDVLTRITYPEGGTVDFNYKLKKDIQGEQGPPLWVLSKAEFDDGIVTDLSASEGWAVSNPTIEYDYTGAKLGYREFLGFEAVAETRFDGGSLSQVFEVYNQEGPDRGTLRCSENRGFAIDNRWRVGEKFSEYAVCLADDDPAHKVPIQLPKRNFQGITQSCLSNAMARLDQKVLPLQARTEYSYDTEHSATAPTGRGDIQEIRRAFVTDSIVASTFNGSERSTWMQIKVDHDTFPYRMPISSQGFSNDGLARAQTTDWRYEDDHWLFLKTEETKFRGDSSKQLEIIYSHEANYPYYVKEILETDGKSTRRKSFGNYNNGGMPRLIDDNGVITRYSYWGDSVPGTGLLRRSVREPDQYQSAASIHQYRYDVMGRFLIKREPGGLETRYGYDRLGLLKWDELPGVTRRNYNYSNVGILGVSRDRDELSSFQKVVRIDNIGGQQIINFDWLDGFNRKWRRGLYIEGNRDVAMDFNSDGKIDHLLDFRGDREWLQSHSADYLLKDYRLDAPGRRQCESLPYVDNSEPESWSTLLHDSMQRPAYSRDMTGYGTYHDHEVNENDLATKTRLNDDGHFIRMTMDGFNRLVEKNNNDLITETYQNSDWGGRVRRTDGRNFTQIWEINGWSEPIKSCRQINSGQLPNNNECPASWSTRDMSYDDFGRIIVSTDPMGNQTQITYGHCGKPVRIETPSVSNVDNKQRPVTKILYDGACRDVEITNPRGFSTKTRYDSAGRITQIAEAVGTPEEATINMGYDELGRNIWVSNFTGRRQYAVPDFRNFLVQRWYGTDSHTETVHGIHGDVQSKTTATGRSVIYNSDRMNRTTRATWDTEVCNINALNNGSFGLQNQTVNHRFIYDRKGRVTDEYNANGGRLHYDYDNADRLSRSYATRLNAPGQYDSSVFSQRTYDLSGNLTRLESPGGVAWETDYNGLGQAIVQKLVARDGTTLESQVEFDLNGRVLEQISIAGIHGSTCDVKDADRDAYTSRLRYAPSGLPIRLEGPKDNNGNRRWMESEYDLTGQPILIRDRFNQIETSEYDERLRLRRIVDIFGQHTEWEYNANNRISLVNDSLGGQHLFDYDEFGQRSGGIDNRGFHRFGSFDEDGRQLIGASEINATTELWSGKEIEHTVDGRVKQINQLSFTGPPDQQSVWQQHETLKICHDAIGRPLAWRDDAGHVVQSRYDSRGRKQADLLRRLPNNNWVVNTYKYNDDDLLIHEGRTLDSTAQRNINIEYRYDKFNRLEQEVGPDDNHVVTYQYDSQHQLCERQEIRNGELLLESRFIYAADGSIVEQEHSNDTVTTTFDAQGNLDSESNEAADWDYDYDAYGRISRQTQIIDGVTGSFSTDYRYDSHGRLERIELPDIPGLAHTPSEIEFSYATSGLLDAITVDSEPLFSQPGYDGKGRLVNWKLGNQLDMSYTFDENERLQEQRTERNGVLLNGRRYSYDGAGNIRLIDDLTDDQFDTTVVNDELNRIKSQSSVALGGTIEYVWNDQNLPARIIDPTGSTINFAYRDDTSLELRQTSGGGVAYEYNHLYQRKHVENGPLELRYNDSGQLTEVHRAGSQIIDIRYDSSGRRIRHNDKVYLYGADSLPMAELTLGSNGRPNGAIFNFSLGASLAMTLDAETGEVHYYDTDSLATPILQADTSGNITATRNYDAYGRILNETGIFATDIGFQGNYLLPQVGYYLMHYRTYDPETLSFTTTDPLGTASSGNRYDFASANPLLLHDRSGLDPASDGNWQGSYSGQDADASFTYEETAEGMAVTVSLNQAAPLPDLMFETSVFLGVDSVFRDPAAVLQMNEIMEVERVFRDGNMSTTLRDHMIKNNLEDMLGSRSEAEKFLHTYELVLEGGGDIYKGQGHLYKFTRWEWSGPTPGTVEHRINVGDMANSGRVEMKQAFNNADVWFPVTSENDLKVMKDWQRVHDVANTAVVVGEIITTAPIAVAGGLKAGAIAYQGSRATGAGRLAAAAESVVPSLKTVFLGEGDELIRSSYQQFRPGYEAPTNMLLVPDDVKWASTMTPVLNYDSRGNIARELYYFAHGRRASGGRGATPLIPVEHTLGRASGFPTYRNVPVPPQLYIERIRAAGHQPGQSIRLMSCHLGSNCKLMQAVSKAFPDSFVHGATHRVRVFVDQTGGTVGSPSVVDGGFWRTFLNGVPQ